MSGLARRISEMKSKGKPKKPPMTFDQGGAPIANAIEGGKGKKLQNGPKGDHGHQGISLGLANALHAMKRKKK